MTDPLNSAILAASAGAAVVRNASPTGHAEPTAYFDVVLPCGINQIATINAFNSVYSNVLRSPMDISGSLGTLDHPESKAHGYPLMQFSSPIPRGVRPEDHLNALKDTLTHGLGIDVKNFPANTTPEEIVRQLTSTLEQKDAFCPQVSELTPRHWLPTRDLRPTGHHIG